MRHLYISACVLCLLACKGPEAGTPPPSAGAAPGGTAPDSRPLQQAMIGRFQVDVDRLDERPEVAALPPEKRREAVEMARKMVGSLSFEFGADKTYAVSLGGKTNAGTWSLEKAEADRVELKVVETGGEAEQVVLERGPKGLRLLRPDGDALPLRPAQ